MQHTYYKKSLFLLLLVLPFWAGAQPYLLLDRQLRQPAELSEYLEPRKIATQYFPVFSQDVDELIKATELIIDQLDRYTPGDMASEMTAGHTRIVINKKDDAAQNNMTINLLTRAGNSGFSLELLNRQDSRQRGIKKLNSFLNYLRNNRLLLREPL